MIKKKKEKIIYLIERHSPQLGIFNYFSDVQHCRLQKELLSNVLGFFENNILPMINNIYDNFDYNQVENDVDTAAICGMSVSEYQAYISYLESCIHFQAIIQLWEQQVVSTILFSVGQTNKIILKKLDEYGNLIKADEVNTIDFKIFKDILFYIFDIDITNWETWDKISEIRKIVNVMKHSMGDSLDFVRQNYPDVVSFDKESGDDSVTFSHSSLLDFNINIFNDFHNYLNYFIQFWDEIPYRVNKEIQF